MPSSSTSDYWHDLQMKELLQGIAITPLTDLYVALFTVAPNLDGTGGTEVPTSGTNYARQQISVATSSWNISGLEFSNSNDVTFGVPSANWGTVNATALFDSASGGNLIQVATLQNPKTISNGDGAPRVLAGQLRITRGTC